MLAQIAALTNMVNGFAAQISSLQVEGENNAFATYHAVYSIEGALLTLAQGTGQSNAIVPFVNAMSGATLGLQRYQKR